MIDPATLTAGELVAYATAGPGRSRYQFVRVGCATDMEPCPNGPWNVTVRLYRGGEPRGMTQCLNAMELDRVAP
jgi:hypothetical protein